MSFKASCPQSALSCVLVQFTIVKIFMQNERVELNISYYLNIRVEFNDERGRGVAHEYDTCPSYDENVTNTHTHTQTHKST